MADGQLKLEPISPKLLRDMSAEEITEMLDKLMRYIDVLIPVDAEATFYLHNIDNMTSSFLTTLNSFNAPEMLRQAANRLEKGNK